MKISVITLFPEVFENILNFSILKRAQEKGLVEFNLVNLRNFGLGKHKIVDDKPYGGGAGMVLRVDVLHSAINSIKKNDKNTKVVLMDPRGKVFNQKIANKLSKEKSLTFICGHYEGYDERIRKYIDLEVSIGDFVLTGGEIPAMAVIDSTVRLIPRVLGKTESIEQESFSPKNKGLLEYPQYTRPFEYDNEKVPNNLLSGNHLEIYNSRIREAAKITKLNRPDLVKK